MEINVNKEICAYKEAADNKAVCLLSCGNRHCCWHILRLKRHFRQGNGELALHDCRTSCGGNGIF